MTIPTFVPLRPIWTDRDGLYGADWRQQRLLAVTQGTLEIARSAMAIKNVEWGNHLYSRAINEIDQVIASETATLEDKP